MLCAPYCSSVKVQQKMCKAEGYERVTSRHRPRPYTGMAAPVTSFPAPPASHTIRLATDAGCTHVEVSAPDMALRLAGVSIVPGRITFAVMPACLFSSATVRISDTSAALDAL